MPEFSFTVTYVQGPEAIERVESFPIGERFAFRVGASREAALRAAIESETGERRDVLQDLYRELVLSNFTRFQNAGGVTAEPLLNATYPATGSLLNFERVSETFNMAGAILHNAKKGVGPGYRHLPGILDGLLKARIIQPARCAGSPDPLQR
jgi:hypothetical protein